MKKTKEKVGIILSYIILIIGAISVMFPFIWMILTSLKQGNEVMVMPPKLFPKEIQWQNFKDALDAVPYTKYLFNSIFVATCVTIGELITTILAAYAFSYIPFKFKQVLFILLIATMMVPSEILMIPNYVTLSSLGWINTYKSLIIPWCTSVFSIFLLKQQFDNVPKSYYKTAKVDGCNGFKFLWRVLVPISKTTIFSVAILKFISCWNSYMWPLIVTNTEEMRTLPVGLAAFSTEAGVHYNTLMAFSVLMVTPIIILYFYTQKYILNGVSKSGLKG